MNQAQARQQMTAIAERHPNFIRPEQINQIIGLSQEQKPKVQQLVNSCWNLLSTKPENDPQFQTALSKLEEISNNIAKLVQTQRAKLAQQQQGQAGNAQAQQNQQRQAVQAGQAKPGTSAPAQQGPSKAVLEALAKQQFALPADIQPGTEAAQKTINGYKQQFLGILTRMEKVMTQLTSLNQLIQQGKATPEQYSGPQQQLLKDKEQCKKAINAFQAQQQANARALQARQQAQAAGQNASAKPVVSVNTAVANAKGTGAPGSASTASPAFKGQTPISATAPAAAATSSASPVSTTQPQNAPFSATSAPQNRPPQRPGLTTQQPQSSSTPTVGANPIPLSQTAALNAARSHSEQQQQRSNSQSQYPSLGQSTPSNQPKHVISKNLPGNTMAPPTPIPMGPTRPTLASVGTISQPPVSRQPTFQLEGEGASRVLSKKKLDELVRQVTGGTETLTPEVEEIIMEIADEFVDNVITASCRLAKLRPDKTLEIKDLQTVLERNYNIRIPGYSLDETRVVRRVQPAPSWQAKMNAINAAKVMNGKTDA